MAALSLSDGSGSVTTPVCHVRNFMCSSCKSPQQMSDGLCKLGLDFTSGNGDSGITTAGIKTKVRLKSKPADPTGCRGNEATLGRGAAGSLCPKKTPCAAMLLLSFEVMPQRVHISQYINGKREKRRRPHLYSREQMASEFPTKTVPGDKSNALSARYTQGTSYLLSLSDCLEEVWRTQNVQEESPILS